MKNQSSIVLGTWSWGTGAVGGDQVFGNHVGVEELKPVFDEAMKNGLNLWDSAVVYGMGASENVLAAFTKTCCREEVKISTKFTPQIASDTENPVADMLAGSLARFDTDYIDIYWVHNPADVERWTPYMAALVKSGKVKHIGVSNHNLAQIKRAEEILSAEGIHISAVQNHYSLLYRRNEPAFWIIVGRTVSTSGHTWYWSKAHSPASMTRNIPFPKAVSVAIPTTRCCRRSRNSWRPCAP